MKKLIGNLTEKEYRDELKTLIFKVKNTLISKENLESNKDIIYKYNDIMMSNSSLDNIKNEEIIVAIAIEIFLNKYKNLSDEDLANIIGKRLSKYYFIRELLNASNKKESAQVIRQNGIIKLLDKINKYRLKTQV